MIFHNYLYSILCPDSTKRKTDEYVYSSERLKEFCDIIIPPNYSLGVRMALAEFYIRCIKTDAYLNKKLLKVDPYNSYDIIEYTFDPMTDIAEYSDVSLEDIAQAIRNAGITNIRHTDIIGYILIGLEYLLDLCGELNG